MGRLGIAICTAGLAALLCAPAAAQPSVKVYETSRPKSQLDDILNRVSVIRGEVVTKKEEMSNLGTAFLYQRDEQCNYYITNDHVITMMTEDPLVPLPIRAHAPEYTIYSNGVDREVKDKGKLIYTDPVIDYAVIVSPNRGQPPLAPIMLETEGLDLGEKVYLFGTPYAKLPTLYVGHVAGFDTTPIDGVPAIPGYRLQVPASPGSSGSVVFVEREGTYRWAALVHASNQRMMMAYTIPVNAFYEKLHALSGDACAAQARSPAAP